jgi:hypothetical protein
VPLLDFEFHTKSPVACNLPLNIEREITGHRAETGATRTVIR